MILVLMCIFLATMYSYCEGVETYGNIVISSVTNVYDGDTFTANINGWPDIISKNISIRIYGIDTPELKGTREEVKQIAILAKSFSASALLGDKTIELRNIRRGKYFRIIAEVYIDGKNLSELLLKSGLAKKYYGGKRPIW